MNRYDNILMLEDTLDIFEKGKYSVNDKTIKTILSKKQKEKCYVYLPEDIKKILEATDLKHPYKVDELKIECKNIDSFSLAIEQYQKYPELFLEKNRNKTLVLNFANPVNPGGGVRRGARAQEEDLCRKSSLLISLESRFAKRYYNYNKSLNTFLGSDAIILTPDVEIIKDYNGELLEESVIVSVMTCAAPMITNGKEGLTEAEYRQMFYRRICTILKCAAYWGYRVLVLGAFGCGAFGNDAKLVSDMFYKAIKEFNYDGKTANYFFERIDFGVLDTTTEKYNFNAFYKKINYLNACNSNSSSEQLCNCSPETDVIFFWHEYGKNGAFSNWYECEFEVDDFCYQSVEQYLMAQKAKLFHDAKIHTAILRASSPKECKELGRKVTPFDNEIWASHRYEILKKGVFAKFSQNEKMKQELISTGDSLIAEASPYDGVYGIKLTATDAVLIQPKNWPGENLLGRVLMEVRSELI